jgi:hypothetical protein
MKSFVPFIFAILFCITVSAQTNKNPYNVYQSSEAFNPTKAYVGFSTGINNMAGLLGVSLDAVVNENLTLGGGIGLSTWGYKFQVNLQYYPKGWYGFYMKGGYSYNSGLERFEPEMELSNGRMEYVMMDLEPVGNVFIAAGHAWKVGKGNNKFYLERGYAVPMVTVDYYTIYDETTILSSTSEDVLRIMRPGGLVIAAGFCLAL